MKKLLIIGAGNMGGALASGLQQNKAFTHQIDVFDIHAHKAKQLAATAKIGVVENLASLQTYEVIVLAIKPQDLSKLSDSIKTSGLNKKALVISLLAGTDLAHLAKTLSWQGATVRSMSNVAASVNEAATALCANGTCNEAQRELATLVFSSIGLALWVEERHMDTVTGLSGSGPAYIFMVIEALIDGGVRMGLPRQTARQLTIQTVLGAATLVEKSNTHPAILKDQVTTPAGTTINAIHELESRGLRAMLMSAVETATTCSSKLRQDAESKKDA